MFKLVIHHWPYLLLSSLAAIVYVVLNSASIWLTASLINNILMDFEHLKSHTGRSGYPHLERTTEILDKWSNFTKHSPGYTESSLPDHNGGISD